MNIPSISLRRIVSVFSLSAGMILFALGIAALFVGRASDGPVHFSKRWYKSAETPTTRPITAFSVGVMLEGSVVCASIGRDTRIRSPERRIGSYPGPVSLRIEDVGGESATSWRRQVTVVCQRWIAVTSLLLISISLIAFSGRRYVQSFLRKRAGKCVHCCYDLTRNFSGICPECGTKIKT